MKNPALFPSLTLLAGLLLAVAPAQAGMYKWYDEHGKVHYTQQKPPPGARRAPISNNVSVVGADDSAARRSRSSGRGDFQAGGSPGEWQAQREKANQIRKQRLQQQIRDLERRSRQAGLGKKSKQRPALNIPRERARGPGAAPMAPMAPGVNDQY